MAYNPGWKTVKQPDGTFNVVRGSRTVARGFSNRAAALAYISELMQQYRKNQGKDK